MVTKTKAIPMDDDIYKKYEGDGVSTIDPYESAEQWGAPDGESSIELGDEGEKFAGGERVTESIENNVADLSVDLTSEPISQDRDDTKSYGTAPSTAEPTTSAERLNPGQQDTPEATKPEASDNAATGPTNAGTTTTPKRRGRPAKAATAPVAAEGDAK